MNVTKRDGTTQPLCIEKINSVVEWACDGLDANTSDVIMNARMKLSDGMKTTKIHETLIDSAYELISEEMPDYQYVAGRLLNFYTRKQVFGVFLDEDMPHILDVVEKNTKLGLYDTQLKDKFSKEDWDRINSFIDHSFDGKFEHGAYLKMIQSYLAKNRHTNYVYETPQIAFILIAATKFNDLDDIKEYYNLLKGRWLNIPTPIMAGVRTPTRQYASCTLIDTDDTLDSIYASSHAIGRFVSRKAGIGQNMGRVRGLGSPIRGGEATHTGVIPFLKLSQAATKSCSQGGIRDGGSTVAFPIWHKEISDIIVLKNNKGTDQNRVRFIDYSIQLSRLFLTRMVKKEKISLFSTSDAPKLYDLWGGDKFDEQYLAYENDKSVPRVEVDGRELLLELLSERMNTGRIYIQMLDNVNSNSPWKELVKMSNLCVSGDERVPTNKGLLTARELYEMGCELQLWDNESVVDSTKMELIEKDADTYKITLENGMTHTVTGYHKIKALEKNPSDKKRPKFTNYTCDELSIGDKVAIQTNKGIFGTKDMVREAFLLGLYQSDGTQSGKDKKHIHLDVWENDFDIIDTVEKYMKELYIEYDCENIENTTQRELTLFNDCGTSIGGVRKKRLTNTTLLGRTLNFKKGSIPQWIWESNEETQWSYVNGLFIADGTVNLTPSDVLYIAYTDTSKTFCDELLLLLRNLGMQFSLHKNGDECMQMMPDGNGGKKEYLCNETYRLVCGNKNDGLKLNENTGFLDRKNVVLEDRVYRDNTKKTSKILSIEYVGKQDVFCLKVDSDKHHWVCNGIITHNCQEIKLITAPIQDINDTVGEIALCMLGGINLGKIGGSNTFHKLEKPLKYLVRGIDSLMDIQDYPVKASEKQKGRRSIGIGVTNFAYWMAKNGFRYEDENALPLIDELFEHIQFYALKASMEMAKEFGACEYFDQTKYADGVLPIDRYNKKVDELVQREYTLDWEWLRGEIKKYGLRHSVLTAIMPSESSSLVTNSTNGIEPPRSLVSVKTNKGGNIKIVVPSIKSLGKMYTKAWDLKSNSCINKITAVIQKWIDQSISVNHYYNPLHYPSSGIPTSVVMNDVLEFYKYGGNNLYYANTYDVQMKDDSVDSGCDSGGCTL